MDTMLDAIDGVSFADLSGILMLTESVVILHIFCIWPKGRQQYD